MTEKKVKKHFRGINLEFRKYFPLFTYNNAIGAYDFLCERGYLSQPLLYLSGFFDQYRDDYYVKLLSVSQRGEWLEWIKFFLRGVVQQSNDAIEDSKKIFNLFTEYKMALRNTKKIPETAHRLIDEIFINPILSISRLSRKWKLPFNSIKRGIIRLEEIGILHEVTDKKRNKLYQAKKLMKLLTSNDRRTG